MKKETIILGYQKDKVVKMSDRTKNRHIAVLGGSGSGKTSEITMLAVQAAERGELVVEINMRNCLNPECLMKSVKEAYLPKCKKINVAEGITLPLFRKKDDEDASKVIHRITNMLEQSGNLTRIQTTYLKNAVASVYEFGKFEEYGIRSISDFLECQEESTARNVAGNLRALLDNNLVQDGEDPFENTSGIVELDVNDLEYDDQLVVVNFILDYLLRKAEGGAFVKQNIRIVIDECQNFSYAKGSTMYTLLNESRRLGIGLILAATEMHTNKDTSVLEQCGTVLYYAPTPTSRKKIAKKIAPHDVQRWVYKLSELKTGEFAAVGQFVTENDKLVTKPLVLKGCVPDESIKVETLAKP